MRPGVRVETSFLTGGRPSPAAFDFDGALPYDESDKRFRKVGPLVFHLTDILARRFAIDADPGSVQCLAPPDMLRFEGIAFSTSGALLGVATADTNAVLLFARGADGRFESEPCERINGLDYPHDIAFASFGSTELLAVAQRGGAVSLLARNGDGRYNPEPVVAIQGPESLLEFSDGVAFVPPRNEYLAVCNLLTGVICFFPRVSRDPVRFGDRPTFTLTHESIDQPDGLAFSRCGTWLAIANHAGHSVSVFRRQWFSDGAPQYGPEPAAVITGADLHYPHSVAFTADGRHLVVTNAGANYFSAYRTGRSLRTRSAPEPVLRQTVTDEATFHAVNSENKMEGGPKGIAIHARELAVCSPEFGVKIFALR